MNNVTLPRPQGVLLAALVDLAFAILTRPAVRANLRADWAALSQEIAAAAGRPMIDERFISDEAEMLAQALGQLIEVPGGVDAPLYVRWAKIAGVLLPDVHAALAKALAAERTAP